MYTILERQIPIVSIIFKKYNWRFYKTENDRYRIVGKKYILEPSDTT